MFIVIVLDLMKFEQKFTVEVKSLTHAIAEVNNVDDDDYRFIIEVRVDAGNRLIAALIQDLIIVFYLLSLKFNYNEPHNLNC